MCHAVIPLTVGYDGSRVIEVGTLADLQAINHQLGGHYRLIADIDASETKNWNDGKGFASIGSVHRPFAGVLDGNGHIIRNLHINRGWEDDVGLLGVLSGSGEVRNVTLVDAKVSGNKFVGGLVGVSKGNITACQVYGEVSGNEQFVGGLVGSNFGSIAKCHTFGGVSGNNRFVGGLVGHNEGNITACRASGAVSGNDRFVGGLVGVSKGDITECHASGKVSGNENVGGLVGHNEGNITQCHASGGALGNKLVGGLVGCNEGDITECHVSGEVSGNKSVGGLVGFDKATVTKSYWDIQTTGQMDSRGNGEGKTSSEMKQRAVFVGWDFENVWQIEEGQSYPTLRCFAEGGRSKVFA